MSLGESRSVGGSCQGAATDDLILKLPTLSEPWLQGLAAKPSDGPCSVLAVPSADGGVELRLSYARPKGVSRRLRTLEFETSTHFIVDHWFEAKSAAGATKPSSARKTKEQEIALPGDAPPFLGAFVEKMSWESILGAESRSFDVTGSGLDRFRGFDREQNVGNDARPLAKRKLQIPLLFFAPLDRPLSFAETVFPFPTFAATAAHPTKQQQAAIDGMNFAVALAREKKWLKARESIEILQKSAYASELPDSDSRWWALRGYVYVKAGDEFLAAPAEETLKEPDGRVISKRDVGRMLHRQGLILWSDGLRKTAGSGGGFQDHVEYMALESVRRLFLDNIHYGAASLTGWLLRYSWPDRIEERFRYLHAESFLQLGMFDEAKGLFSKFYEERKGTPVSARIDRRLVPSSAFRLGDLEIRRGAFEAATQAYAAALAGNLGPGKVNFEGAWYPDEVRNFPEFFLNRAFATTRLGHYADALNDLRAFLYFVPHDADVGIAYYLVGDLLDRLGVDTAKVDGAWRECSFKVADSLGARLCQAREAARQLPRDPESRWPRLIGLIEEARSSRLKSPPRNLSAVDLDFFVQILVAHAFVEAGKPDQALLRLEALEKIEASRYLRDWYREYQITAFSGVQSARIANGKAREAIVEYEKRRLTTFLGSDRPAILFRVAEAFAQSQLWPEAKAALDSADRLAESFKDADGRPFDPTPEDWHRLRARVLIGLISTQPRQAVEARRALAKVNKNSIDFRRMSLDLALATKDEKAQADAWKARLSKDALSWEEIVDYESLLGRLGRAYFADRRRLLESRVGAWFAEREKFGEKAAPPTELLSKLAESRAEANDLAGALRVWEHLLGGSPAPEDGARYSFRKGEILRKLGRLDEARQSFGAARTLAPESLWGQLSAAVLAEIPSN